VFLDAIALGEEPYRCLAPTDWGNLVNGRIFECGRTRFRDSYFSMISILHLMLYYVHYYLYH
jgi:hypothetical protein